jgi:creatinine amidohydrolase
MNWEHLTSPEFAAAVQECEGVCLLPIGVIEKHGDHLPLGQDTIYIHSVCSRAAEEEKAVVFPFYYFGQILEGKHVPGTIALRADLQLQLLESMCDEIGRNGLSKIILVNGHGGNNAMLPYFCQLMLDTEKDYMTFLSGFPHPTDEVKRVLEADEDGHAGEGETSTMMALRPELAKPERFAEYGSSLARMKAFEEAGLSTGVSWYANYPGHLAASKAPFTPEKGEILIENHVDFIRRQIRLVKEDDTPTTLYREFHQRARKPENRYP